MKILVFCFGSKFVENKSSGELVMDCDNVTLLAPADGFNKFFEGSNGY